jgi:hypothetical protein
MTEAKSVAALPRRRRPTMRILASLLIITNEARLLCADASNPKST